MVLKNTQMAADEYIYVEIPRWYRYLITAIIYISVAAIFMATTVTLILGLEWFPATEGYLTIFVAGNATCFFGGLLGAILLIIAVYFFPREIRPKSHPSYGKLPLAR